MTGHTTTFIDQKMSAIEAAVWDQVYWSDFQREREMHAFDKISKIRVLPASQSAEDQLI